MPSYTLIKPGLGAVPNRLHDTLLAASLAVETVLGIEPDTAIVVAPADDLQSALDALLAGFDPSVPSASEQRDEADALDLASLRDQYQQLKDGLDTIRSHMGQIQNGPNSPTAAQTGTALKLLAGDITTLCNGPDRLLDTLAVFVRRQGAA